MKTLTPAALDAAWSLAYERFYPPLCSPPDENSKAAGVALGGPGRQVDCTLPASDGQGVCAFKSSNLDKARCIVRKGSTVDYMGLRARVVGVRLGMWWGNTVMTSQPINLPCAWVRVVA